jgi:NitT/TauT family transport system substrate-binding protein
MSSNSGANTVAFRTKRVLARTLLASVLGLSGGAAHAETSALRIGSGFGIHYLPFYVMQREKLVEKEAEKLGISNLSVEYKVLSGGAAYNDALLSGNLDAIGSGVGPFAILWDKTKGNQNVRGIAAMGDIPLVLLANDARIKSIKDIKEGDRIALPAVKASMQATILQMAAAKLFGDSGYKDLDKYTVSMAHSDATTAMLAGQGVINMHFSVAPYSTRALQDGRVHQIASSEEIVGGPMSFNVVSMTERFYKENPKVTQALSAALIDAMDLIRADRPLAAQIYFEGNKGAATDVAMVEKILSDPSFNYTVVPHGVGKFIQFMHQIGSVKNDPRSWKDVFFESASSLQGN